MSTLSAEPASIRKLCVDWRQLIGSVVAVPSSKAVTPSNSLLFRNLAAGLFDGKSAASFARAGIGYAEGVVIALLRNRDDVPNRRIPLRMG